MAPVYNTIPQADDEPLVQTKAAPTSIKKLIFTAAAASFVLGACAATVVAPKSAIGTYQFAAGSNGGCPPAGSTTEEDCKAAGCTWAPGVYPADVTTNGGICIPTPADPNMPKIKDCHHHEYVCRYHHHDGHCCEYKCVGSKDSCKALPGGKVESSAGGHAYEDSDGALGRKALAAAATAVLAGLAF